MKTTLKTNITVKDICEGSAIMFELGELYGFPCDESLDNNNTQYDPNNDESIADNDANTGTNCFLYDGVMERINFRQQKSLDYQTISDQEKCWFMLLYCPELSTSVDETIKKDKIDNETYPNPSEDFTYIKFFLNQSVSQSNIDLFDFLGNKIQSIILNDLNIGENIIKLKTNDFTTGIYFYKIHLDNSSLYGKFIISK